MFYIKEMNIRPAYVSKHMSNREKQVILLMIPWGEKLHHLAVLSFFFFNLQSHEKVCQNKDFCNIGMPSEGTKSLINTKKIDKTSFVIYADLECFIEKIVRCKDDPENSSATKLG